MKPNVDILVVVNDGTVLLHNFCFIGFDHAEVLSLRSSSDFGTRAIVTKVDGDAVAQKLHSEKL